MRLIDADMAIEVADAVWTVTGDTNVAKVWQQIKDLPTVDAVPVRHAHWFYYPDWEEEGECCYECSACGMGSEVDYDYCMKCGARMDKDEID